MSARYARDSAVVLRRDEEQVVHRVASACGGHPLPSLQHYEIACDRGRVSSWHLTADLLPHDRAVCRRECGEACGLRRCKRCWPEGGATP